MLHTDSSSRDVAGFPQITFPGTKSVFEEELHLCLINSDPSECNKNISLYIKSVTDIISIESKETNYHQLSVYAMKLLTSNMFIRNYSLCVGKLLGLLSAFTSIQKYQLATGEAATGESDERMMELVCIVLFLLLKLKNTEDEEEDADLKEFREVISKEEVFQMLSCCNFITIIANFMVSHIEHPQKSFVLLKFCGDIIFEYLYHVVLLSDEEFDTLVTKTDLIPALIKDLLQNQSLHDYNIDEEEWENEEKLIAYEEFKLLLLINEQYLMKSYSCRDVRNQVFDGLMRGFGSSESNESVNSNISGFMNLLVFHLNREESQIIKILISKFLYLIFTSSYTAKLYYLNDLKILVDIFMRELNDIEYLDDTDAQNRILVLTYLKVLYPMMTFSQLAELSEGYKNEEISNTLSSLITNISSVSGIQGNSDDANKQQLSQISDLANRCLSVSWLKRKKKNSLFKNAHANASASSLTSNNSVSSSSNTTKPPFERTMSSSSTDSIAHSFTRVASVRASTRSDYHKHTIKHNVNHSEETQPDIDLARANNNNVFLQNFDDLHLDRSASKIQQKLERRQSNILDLPHEYLSKVPEEKTLPQKPIFNMSTHNSVSSNESSLASKARKKRAPLPPINQSRTPVPEGSDRLQPAERATRSLSPTPQFNSRSAPPPPPPPRRRR